MRRVAFLLGALLACDTTTEPPSNTWRKAPSLPDARFAGFAASDGAHLWYVGGLAENADAMPDPKPSAHVDILMIGTNHWSRGPDLPDESAKNHVAATQYAGKIYVLGGFDGTAPKASAFVLDGAAWRRLKDAPIARGAATAASIGAKIYVAGGAPAEDMPSIAEVDAYDPASDAWATVAPLPTPREHVASCTIKGKLVVIGGWNEKHEVQSVVEAYDPQANAWERWPDLPTARGAIGAVSIDEHCYVIGGEIWSGNPPATFGENEMYDSMSMRWAVLAPMPTPRHSLGLTVVGKEIWAIGGGPVQGNSYTPVVEAYLP